jgi:nucleotide-binding universal stress UspA family protein
MLPIRTILHATDFSDSSSFAFRLACALARDYSARLIVLHVAAPPPVVGYAEGIMIPEPEEGLEELQVKLDEMQPHEPGVAVERRLVEGNSTTEILRAAQETHCDLIVIGTHGRRGLPRLLMGSVAEKVVRRAPCPVLTVRQPLAASRHVEEGAAATLQPTA